MVTLAALCLANGLDMAAAGETELTRIWTKVEKIRAKQAAKPKHSPLPTLSRPAVAEGWKAVPVEPTEAMLKASRGAIRALIQSVPKEERKARFKTQGLYGCLVDEPEKSQIRYKAMLAAAPASPVIAEGVGRSDVLAFCKDALEKLPIYATKDGVWINFRAKGSAMLKLSFSSEAEEQCVRQSAELRDKALAMLAAIASPTTGDGPCPKEVKP